jgi:multiple sugar transport system substrate-binding protein
VSRSIHRYAILAAVATLALAASACGGGGGGGGGGGSTSTQGKPSAPVTITLWHGQNQTAGKVIKSLVDDFNRTHPDVKVDAEIGAPADNLYSKTTAALAGGKYPDVVYQFGPNVASLARSPKALDLTDAVKTQAWNWGDFFPAAREAVTIDGRVRAIPALIDSMAVVYNKRLFKQAGIPAPKADWTWDDYRAIAKQLTNKGKGTFGTGWPGVGDEDTVWRIWPMIWDLGGDVLAPDGKQVGYGGQSGLRALTLVNEMAAQDKSVYIDKTAGSEQMYRVFNSNRMGMVPTGPWELPEIIQSKVDYGVVPMPTFNGKPVTISGPDTWMLFNNGEAKAKAAQEFVQWLTQPSQDARWDVDAGSLPLRRSTAAQAVWKDHVAELPGLSTFVDVLNEARVRPVIKAYPKISEALGQSIAGTLLGQQAPPSALQKAVDGGNKALEEQ